MKRINIGILIITCVLCFLPTVFGIIYYNELPEMVAIHFNINNEPDGYMSKAAFVYVFPVVATIIQAFTCIMVDKRVEVSGGKNSAIWVCKLICPIIIVAMHVGVIYYSLENTFDMRRLASIVLGVTLIITGWYMPRSENDKYINFPRINDEKIYDQTKKTFGKLIVIDGMLFIVSAIFNVKLSIIVLALMILEIIILYIYATMKNKDIARRV